MLRFRPCLLRAFRTTSAALAKGARAAPQPTAAAAAPPRPASRPPPPPSDADPDADPSPRFGKDFPSQLARQVDFCKRELAKLRGSTATPNMLDAVTVTAYGETQQLKDLAQVALKGPLLLVVSPFDSALLDTIAEAIRDAELGLNPQAEGNMLRVPVPRASKETREAAAKLVAGVAEQAKTRVRRVRAAELGRLKEQTGVSEDDVKRDSKAVEDAVAAAVAEIGKLAAAKKLLVEKE